MAVRIKNIKIDGKRVKNLEQVKVAKWIEEWLEGMEGVEGEVEVSRYYADRWYPIGWIEKRIEEEIKGSLKTLGDERRLRKEEVESEKDLKEMYQEKAEELAQERHGKEFEELPVVQQELVYEMAIVLVGEELQEKAESLGEEGKDE